jgi:hypothetical protein
MIVAPSTIMQQQQQHRAGWVPVNATLQCMQCATNFGVFTWRHHCRACGALVCDDCSKFRSREVRGYEGVHVRVCTACYHNELAMLVVWHSRFSFKARVVPDLVEARKLYDGLSGSWSRVLVRMKDGVVLYSWFKNAEWQAKVMNRAMCERNERRKAVPSMPTPAMVIVAPATPQHPSLGTFNNVFFAYRSSASEPFRHIWLPISSLDQLPTILDTCKKISANRNAIQGAMIAPDGTCHYAFALDDGAMDNEAVATAVESTLQNLPTMLAWHSSETNSYNHRMVRRLIELPAAFAYLQNADAVVIMDLGGHILQERNCTPAWKNALAVHGGAAILKELHFPLVAVAMHGSRGIATYSDMFSAYTAAMQSSNRATATTPTTSKELENTSNGGNGGAVFALNETDLANESVDAAILQAHAEMDLSKGLKQLCHAAAVVLRTDAAQAKQQQATTSQPVLTPPPAPVELDCPICMERFNLEAKRPVICASCGNTACVECMNHLRNCASCRAVLPGTGRHPPNVALMRLIDIA